jgi:DNA polymerase
MRGKRRIHKRPNAYEIERCKWWLDQELALVKPKVVVALGVTAAQSLLGRKVTITGMRGRPHPLGDDITIFVTIHPSALLRIEDAAEKRSKYLAFVADLRLARRFL